MSTAISFCQIKDKKRYVSWPFKKLWHLKPAKTLEQNGQIQEYNSLYPKRKFSGKLLTNPPHHDCLVAHIENAKLSAPKYVLCPEKTITTTIATSTTTTATTISAAADLYKLILTF